MCCAFIVGVCGSTLVGFGGLFVFVLVVVCFSCTIPQN